MLSQEEEVLVAAADVIAILRSQAGIRGRVGDVHYDRMRMPYVWVSWSVRRENAHFSDGRVLRSERRERLRVDMLPTGVGFTRWDMGSVAARGYHREVMAAWRRARAARRVIAGMRERGEALYGQHYWKALEVLSKWNEIWFSLTGVADEGGY